MSTFSFFERIRAQKRLTPGESRIAEHMEQTFPVLALESITTICNKADVGRATVVRFIQKLGYASFSSSQHELRTELAQRLQSPKERYKEKRASYDEGDKNIFRQHFEQVIENLNEAYGRIDWEQFQLATQMLAECRGRIFIMGSRSSFAIAFLLYFGLNYLRDNVILCDTMSGMLTTDISQIGPEDILVLAFMRRYSSSSEKTGLWFVERGCPVILLTDREANPLSHLATKQFVIPSGGSLGIFDSRAATVAVIEIIINLVTIELENHLDERFEKMEDAINTFEVFARKSRRPLSGTEKISFKTVRDEDID